MDRLLNRIAVNPRPGGRLSCVARPAALAILLLAAAAVAGDFDHRVAEAQRASATSEGQSYDASLGPPADGAIRACVPPGTAAEADFGRFALVGYVSAAGLVSDVAVQPSTRVSECFAAQFRQLTLPAPPASLALPSGVPIAIEMSVLE